MSDIGPPLEMSRPLLQMPGNEGRNGFRFIGREAVIAAGDNMQLGIRHAAFEMEPNADRADRIGVPPNQKRRCRGVGGGFGAALAMPASRLAELNF